MALQKKTEVVREFPAIRVYRIRALAKGQTRTLDVREYVSAEFEGFTRRGIKLSSRKEVEQLRDILEEVLKGGFFESE